MCSGEAVRRCAHVGDGAAAGEHRDPLLHVEPAGEDHRRERGGHAQFRARDGHRRQLAAQHSSGALQASPSSLHAGTHTSPSQRIEQHAGAFPVWLAPVQAVVACISENQAGYAAEVAKTLQKQGVRAAVDLRNDKITYKIREHSLQKIPFILVVGDKEKASGAVAVRARGNQDLGVMSLAEFQSKLASDITAKA